MSDTYIATAPGEPEPLPGETPSAHRQRIIAHYEQQRATRETPPPAHAPATADPIARVLSQLDALDLNRHMQAVDAARERYEQNLAAAAPSLEKLYSLEGQQAEREKIAAPLAAVEQQAQEYAAQACAFAEQALNLAGSDDALTSSEKGRAAREARWVREDCELLDAATLAQRMRAALAGGDKALIWLYARYGRPRMQALTSELTTAGEDVARCAQARTSIEALRPALDELATSLTSPRIEELRQKAAQVQRQAARLLAHAGLRPSDLLARKRAQLGQMF